MFKSFFIFLIFISVIKAQACSGPDSDPGLTKWSSPSTWPGGVVPWANSFVVIQNGMKVLLDVSPPRLTQIWIKPGGQLVWSSKHGQIELTTGGIIIEGRFDIGDDRCRFDGKAIITLTGIEGVGHIEQTYEMFQKYIGVLPGGRFELHGSLTYPIPTWTQLTKTAFVGDTILTLAGDVSKWPVGGKVVVGTTDYDMYQSEEVEIVACKTCSANQIQLKTGVKYYHYGQITYGVDERAEVGLLSKTIVIRGEMQKACNGSALCKFFNFDTFGGHIKIIQGFGSVHMQGVEIYNMGQTYNLGYYPIHFHMCGDVDTGAYAAWPTFVKDCTIHHTFSRCLTIHGTSGLIVVNNFAYDHYGHCYFFEDASEQRNYLDSNVGLVTKPGYLLPSDRSCDLCLYLKPKNFNGQPTQCSECEAVSTFWITNPNNVLKNNVAGGSARTGFWYLFPIKPSGHSEKLYSYLNPPNIPLGTFYNNKAHSNVDSGMNIDQGHQIYEPNSSIPYQFMSMNTARYKPRVNQADQNSAIATAYFYEYTAYKNKWRGLWARGGDLVFQNCRFADNAIGATLASEGVMPADPGSSQKIVGAIFVGETDNLGVSSNGINTYKGHTIPAWVEFTQRGVEMYDGPTSVSYSTFVNYNTDGFRNMSAVGWFLYNDWVFGPKNKMFGNTFINSNMRILNVPSVYDGSKNQVVLDEDGTLTGTFGASVLSNVPYFYSPKCVPNNLWNMSTCYEKIGSLYIYNLEPWKASYPAGTQAGVFMVRDQYSYYKHTLTGVPNAWPRNTFMPLVMMGRSYTLHFTHPTPPTMRFQMTNFDKGDSIVVGVCYPRWGLTFNVQRTITQGWRVTNTKMTMGASLWAVNNDATGNTAFYDANTGLLFLKFMQQGTRQWNQYCPDSGCEAISVSVTGAGVNTNTGDCTWQAYPTYATREYVTRGDYKTPSCNGVPGLSIDRCGICGGNGSTCVSSVRSNSMAGPSINSSLYNSLPIILLLLLISLFI
eukprot:gene9930-12176_t